MDYSESNIDLNQILATLQLLQQENVALRNLETQWTTYKISHNLLP
jgi:hypothetical protein